MLDKLKEKYCNSKHHIFSGVRNAICKSVDEKNGVNPNAGKEMPPGGAAPVVPTPPAVSGTFPDSVGAGARASASEEAMDEAQPASAKAMAPPAGSDADATRMPPPAPANGLPNAANPTNGLTNTPATGALPPATTGPALPPPPPSSLPPGVSSSPFPTATTAGQGSGANAVAASTSSLPLILGLVCAGLFAALLAAAFIVRHVRQKRAKQAAAQQQSAMEAGIFTPDAMKQVTQEVGPLHPTAGYATVEDFSAAPPALLGDRRADAPQLPNIDTHTRLTMGTGANPSGPPAMPAWPQNGDPQRSIDVIFDNPFTAPVDSSDDSHVYGTPLYDTALAGTGSVRVIRTSGSSSPTKAAADLLQNRHSMEWPDVDDDPLALQRDLIAAGIGSTEGPVEEFPAVPSVDPNDPRLRQD